MLIAYALFLHFVADFVLQSRDMGKRKSIEFKVLLDHCSIQWLTIFLGLSIVMPFYDAAAISILNALIHGVIDWNIWRIYKWNAEQRIVKSVKPQDLHNLKDIRANFKYWEDHMFYCTIGADQLLHSLTLIGLITLIV